MDAPRPSTKEGLGRDDGVMAPALGAGRGRRCRRRVLVLVLVLDGLLAPRRRRQRRLTCDRVGVAHALPAGPLRLLLLAPRSFLLTLREGVPLLLRHVLLLSSASDRLPARPIDRAVTTTPVRPSARSGLPRPCARVRRRTRRADPLRGCGSRSTGSRRSARRRRRRPHAR